ncbi:MAG: ferritin-like domain-containing protein [Myxococcales bacterium]|nr:ferritin-like domain-containing protein [Myxococcales bacterium]
MSEFPRPSEVPRVVTTIHAWAERLLSSSDLDEKLAPATSLAEIREPRAFTVPVNPGRPPRLSFGMHRGKKAAFPATVEALAQPENRGIALHFFANHELLAIELMALVLLRFPGAPIGFRRNLVKTIHEEQDHLRLYLARMRSLGVDLGDVPVSDFFWKALKDIEHPAEFVAGMSLTLEQANLDFAKHYHELFLSLGDLETADVLERVKNDEIRHVRRGARWLDVLSPGPEPLFERYRRVLPAPLTPRRARGLGFARREREEARLPVDFIEAIEVESHSRGRRPDLFVFDPGVEDRIAGRGETRAARQIQRDLAPLMAFVATADDEVLIERVPSGDWCRTLVRAGFEIPRFVTTPSECYQRMRGWGADEASRLPDTTFREPPHRTPSALYSKALALELRSAGWYEPFQAGWPGELLYDAGPLAKLLEHHGPLRLKHPFGASGRHQCKLSCKEDLSASARFVDRTLRDGFGIVVEPELEVVREISILLDVGRSKPVSDILCAFVDKRGSYRGHELGSPFDGMPQELLRSWGSGARLRDALVDVGLQVSRVLERRGHRGPPGSTCASIGRRKACVSRRSARSTRGSRWGTSRARSLGTSLAGHTPFTSSFGMGLG